MASKEWGGCAFLFSYVSRISHNIQDALEQLDQISTGLLASPLHTRNASYNEQRLFIIYLSTSPNTKSIVPSDC